MWFLLFFVLGFYVLVFGFRWLFRLLFLILRIWVIFVYIVNDGKCVTSYFI